MEPFKGTLILPKAYAFTIQQIQRRHLVNIILTFNIIATALILFFVLRETPIEEWVIYLLIGLNTLFIGGLIVFLRAQNDRVKKVVERVRGNEVIFHADFVEFSGTLFIVPNPRAALEAQHPYLKIQFRDIQTVHVTNSSGKVPGKIVLTLMNDKRIVLLRKAFEEAEVQLFQALHSHKVSVPKLQ